MTARSLGSKFHLANGLCFTRTDGPDGDQIRIHRAAPGEELSGTTREEDVICRVSLSAWSSVMAHLSYDGGSDGPRNVDRMLATLADPASVAELLATGEHIMQFFAFGHLPPHLQAVSRPFCELAQSIVATTPRNPERTVALRKLLESKDAAVRAALAKEPTK